MIWIWIAFIAFVLLMLALDFGVFHRKAHVVSHPGDAVPEAPFVQGFIYDGTLSS